MNLFAGRASYDLTNKLRVGGIFTNGDPEGLRRNSLAGLDAIWRTSSFRGNKNLLVGGWTGASFEFNGAPQYEFLIIPFEIAPGVVIPPGPYHFTRWCLEAQTSEHRSVQFGITSWFGSFYTGNLTQWEQYLRWASPRGRLQLGLNVDTNFGHLRAGSFVQRLWQLHFAYAWNPNVVLTSFIQYDSESQNFGTNTRLRWTFKPGNDLFVVWNRGWQRLLITPQDLTLAPESEMIAVKLRWTLRK